jgi:putative endopeptidase
LLVLTNGSVQAAMQKSGLDLSWLDRTCKPCSDFYQFANGNWIKNNPIPPAYSSWGSFNILAENNRNVLHGLLDKAAASNAPAGSNDQKIGDYYGSCMDTAAIEKAGTTPLDPFMKQIDTITDAKSAIPVIAILQLANIDAFFGFGSGADFKDSTSTIGQLGQAGLGLPDREYYLKTDDKRKALRDAYTAHVSKMLTLLGETPAVADADAKSILAMETTMATSQMSRVEERDPAKIYNKMDAAALAKLTPNIDWSAFFTASGVTPAQINVAQPHYFEALSAALGTWTPQQIKTYLRWQTVHGLATSLPQAFVDQNFDFYSKTLTGTATQLDRWKRCVRATDAALGEALGKAYVNQVFPASAKASALIMVGYVKQTLRDDMGQLDWMSAQTKAKAQQKLDAFQLKIGYPDKWRDYGALAIVKGPYATNRIAADTFANQVDYARINKPSDRSRWGMSTPTVNAYYNPTINEIVFPAGILQPPFFDASADMAVNFGGIGAVIGHESTHGFDDEGRKFDLNGNLADWWTAQDATRFEAKSKCIVDQFNALSPFPGAHENGSLVQGEATADLGGLTIAYKAFERWQATHPRRVIDGFTPEQRFFLGFARVWAGSQREQMTQVLIATDPHPFDKFRVNATLSNMPQFAAAWGCKASDTAMVRPAKDRCQIW